MTNLHTDEIAFSGSLTKIGTDENKAIYSKWTLWWCHDKWEQSASAYEHWYYACWKYWWYSVFLTSNNINCRHTNTDVSLVYTCTSVNTHLCQFWQQTTQITDK